MVRKDLRNEPVVRVSELQKWCTIPLLIATVNNDLTVVINPGSTCGKDIDHEVGETVVQEIWSTSAGCGDS